MKTEATELTFTANGWCEQAVAIPSPNFNARPNDMVVDLLVIHNISLPPGQFGGSYIADFFCNTLDCDAHSYFDHLRNVRVSAHFLIDRTGMLMQFVSIADRAWHAGQSRHAGREHCNDFSIGIELEGSDDKAFADAQYDMLARLTDALCKHYPLKDVAGHSDIAPTRKTDPGPHFDWARYESLLNIVSLKTKGVLRFR